VGLIAVGYWSYPRLIGPVKEIITSREDIEEIRQRVRPVLGQELAEAGFALGAPASKPTRVRVVF